MPMIAGWSLAVLLAVEEEEEKEEEEGGEEIMVRAGTDNYMAERCSESNLEGFNVLSDTVINASSDM